MKKILLTLLLSAPALADDEKFASVGFNINQNKKDSGFCVKNGMSNKLSYESFVKVGTTISGHHDVYIMYKNNDCLVNDRKKRNESIGLGYELKFHF